MLKDQANEHLDAKGLRCPEPLMLTRNKIRGMKSGQVLYIAATDPTTERDLVNFCRFMGHEMVSQGVTQAADAEVEQEVLEFWIQKA